MSAILVLPYISNLRVVHRVNFEIAVALSFALYVWKLNPWIAMFLGLSTFSMMFPFYDKESYFAFQAVFYGVILYSVIMNCVQDVNALLNAICILALANVVLMSLQVFNIDPLFSPIKEGNAPVVGFMGNPNHASALLAFSFPAFMRKKWSYCIPVVAGGLLMAFSLGGIVAVCAGLIFYCAINGHKVWPAMAVFLVTCLYLLLTDYDSDSVNVRINAWFETLKYYCQHWIFGSGIGHFKVQVGEKFLRTVNGLSWTTPHNEFLQGLFEMGIMFPVVVAGYYLRIIIRFWQPFHTYNKVAAIPMMAFIIITVNSMVNFPFHIAPTAMVGVVWLGILDIKLKTTGETS